MYENYDYYGTIHHDENPKNMYVAYGVNNNGDYIVTFNTNFNQGYDFFGYDWSVNVNGTTVIYMPVRSQSEWYTNWSKTVTGNCGTHFKCIAYCGCSTCPDNSSNGGLKVADIDLYKSGSWVDILIVNRTTNSITVKPQWNNGSSASNATISVVTLDSEILQYQHIDSSNTEITFSNLTHSTSFIIEGCLTDGIGDHLYKDVNTSTKKLSVENVSISVNLNVIVGVWKSKIDNEYTNTGVYFSSFKCYRLNDDGSKTQDGYYLYDNSTSASREVTIKSLEYFKEYLLVYTVSDTYNIVSSEVKVKTSTPYILIYLDGKWRKAIPYVYYNNKWNTCKCIIKR